MNEQAKIARVISTTKRIYENSLLAIGALVAAPVQAPYFPKDAKSYMYSWPGRDGEFALVACDVCLGCQGVGLSLMIFVFSSGHL